VLHAAGRTFIAGADIKGLENVVWGGDSGAPEMHDLLQRIEQSPKPVVMALHGTALGGGMEVAMAGHYRVAVAEAQMGLPEVNLGIIPGRRCTPSACRGSWAWTRADDDRVGPANKAAERCRTASSIASWTISTRDRWRSRAKSSPRETAPEDEPSAPTKLPKPSELPSMVAAAQALAKKVRPQPARARGGDCRGGGGGPRSPSTRAARRSATSSSS
jgi:3-hydroxyacyl-CoA dehydrogenase